MFEGLEKLYTTLVFRDLKYVILGAIPVAFVIVNEGLITLFRSDAVLATGGFLATSYVVGMALYHAGMTIPTKNSPLIRMYGARDSANGKSAFEKREIDALRKLSHMEESERRYFERLIYTNPAIIYCT